MLARGGGVAERDGSDGPSVWRHARAELSSDPAAQGEGRCQLQADDWEDKIQPAAQVGSRRERRPQRSGNFIRCYPVSECIQHLFVARLKLFT